MRKRPDKNEKPTFESAFHLVREDPDARLAVALAVALAWSMGFALGFLLGEREGAGPGAEGKADDA